MSGICSLAYLSFNGFQIRLDGIGLANEEGILFLVPVDTGFKVIDNLVDLLSLDAGGLSLFLKSL